jgi:5-methyltetrahydrofolate--homocysteine methyltransferase
MQTILRGRDRAIIISHENPTIIVGERINPTNRSVLAEAIRQGNWNFIRDEAVNQVKRGADVIDVNVSVPGIDEPAAMTHAVKVISEALDVPLSIDSSSGAAIEAALKVCPGKALINSATGEDKVLLPRLELAKKYGAALIVLCHDEAGIVNDAQARFKVAQKVVEKAAAAGVPQEDIVMDPIVLSLGAEPKSAMVSLETTRLIAVNLGMNMTMGVSNVSYGLPNRIYLNANFLAAAIWFGVNVPIINPLAQGLMEAVLSADLMKNHDAYAARYLKHYRNTSQETKKI